MEGDEYVEFSDELSNKILKAYLDDEEITENMSTEGYIIPMTYEEYMICQAEELLDDIEFRMMMIKKKYCK